MSKCQYYDICPSADGWCKNREPQADCIPFLLNYIERKKKEHPKVAYICDQRACEECTDSETCGYTNNIRHAKNFRLFGSVFIED